MPELLPHLPETHWFNASLANRMLDSYSTIFIKPNGGSGGTGIIRIRKKTSSPRYEFRRGRHRKIVSSSSMYKALQIYQKSRKKYIVQRGLKLARYKGRIFDIRMFLQKPPSGWTVSGMVARVADPHFIVTNHKQGGFGKPLDKVLMHIFSNNDSKVKKYIEELKKISLIMAQTLDVRFSDIRELGIDLGIDTDGHVWIIEANSRPFHNLFTQLPDKSMLNNIKRNKLIMGLPYK
jgi:glutathione synthase/RimK-type ligase-like ATP-grasp enzyme